MAFNVLARTIVESAMVELTGQQLQDLARAKPVLARALVLLADATNNGGTVQDRLQPALLNPVVDLVDSIADVVSKAGSIRAKKLTGGAAAKVLRAAATPAPQ